MATAAANFDYDTHFSNQPFLSDSEMAEKIQVLEAAMASLSTCQAPCSLDKEAEDYSSVSLLCEICRKEKKDDDQVIKNGECDHSFCTDCVNNYLQGKIEEGMKIIACPAINCEWNLELDSFRHLLSNEALHLWEKALSGSGRQFIPNFTCSDNYGNGKPQNAFTASTSESPFPQVKTDRQYSSWVEAATAAANEKCKYSSPSMSSLNKIDKSRKSAQRYYQNVQSNRQPNSGSSECKRQLADAKLKNVDAAGNISVATAGETSSGKSKGLEDEKKDYLIVCPPMVVIANTSLRKDENNKWIGMTTQEILNMFSSYAGIAKVRHSYNWQQGHCGTSILIFESSLMGFLEAARLHKHFVGEGTHRHAWKHRPIYFLPSGERQLYGYMALKSDVDDFNKYYSEGSPKLRYEMKSFREMVVNAIKQMGEDNSQLLCLKNKVSELQGHANDLDESNTLLKEKVHMEVKEKEILKRRACEQNEQTLEELDSQEQFYKEQIMNITEARNDKDEDDFEKIKQPQEHREWQRDINSRRQDQSDRTAEERMGFTGPQTTPNPERRWIFYRAPEARTGFGDEKDKDGFEKIKQPQEHREWQRDINSRRQDESDRAAEAGMGFGEPQTTPTPEGQWSFYSEMSFWKEAAIILGVAIPIIWKIIRSF